MRPIPGYENYLISEYGDLYNTRIINRTVNKVLDVPRLLRPSKNIHGYLRAALYKSGVCKVFSLHRLVLLTYVGPSGGKEGAHIDGNCLNNHISNLMWATHAENTEHNRINGVVLKGSEIGASKLVEEQVRDIKARCARGETSKAISKDYDVSPDTIRYIRTGKTWKHVLQAL